MAGTKKPEAILRDTDEVLKSMMKSSPKVALPGKSPKLVMTNSSGDEVAPENVKALERFSEEFVDAVQTGDLAMMQQKGEQLRDGLFVSGFSLADVRELVESEMTPLGIQLQESPEEMLEQAAQRYRAMSAS